MKHVVYSRSALKTLRRMPVNEAKRIVAKVDQYAVKSESLANQVKKLTGSRFIRLRVGDWRVIMDDTGAVLEVLKVGPRGSVYE